MGDKKTATADGEANSRGTYQPGPYRVYSPYLFLGRRSSIERDIGVPLTIGNRFQWIFANMNYTLGLGPLWRFPIVAYAQSSGSFVLAYTIIFFLIGYPLAFLEIALGQSTRRRASKVFQLCAAIEGLNISMGLYCLILPIIYSVLFAYSLFYFYHAFSDEIQWSSCALVNATLKPHICKDLGTDIKCHNCSFISPEELFWNFRVLGGFREEGMESVLESLNLHLLACIIMAWMFTSMFIVEKVRKYTLVIEYWFTPFLLLLMTILLILSIYTAKASGLVNALSGITDFFSPTTEVFRNVHIWREATQQVFFSLGIGSGPLITLGSLCHFKSPVHVDSAIVCVISLSFTLISGVLFFLAAGMTAHSIDNQYLMAEEVNIYGSGVFFIAYSNMFARLPLPQVWSAVFFILIVAIGTRAVLGSIDTSVSVLNSYLPKQWNKKYKLYYFSYVIVIISFLGSLFCITKKDSFVFYVLYSYPGATVLPFMVLVETVGVVWIYGVMRFSGDVEYMLGFKPNAFFRLVWIIIPIYLLILVLASILYEALFKSDEPLLPEPFKIAGWLLVVAVLLPIPIKFVINCVEFYRRKRLREIFRSRDDTGPDDLELWYKSESAYERKSVSNGTEPHGTDKTGEGSTVGGTFDRAGAAKLSEPAFSTVPLYTISENLRRKDTSESLPGKASRFAAMPPMTYDVDTPPSGSSVSLDKGHKLQK